MATGNFQPEISASTGISDFENWAWIWLRTWRNRHWWSPEICNRKFSFQSEFPVFPSRVRKWLRTNLYLALMVSGNFQPEISVDRNFWFVCLCKEEGAATLKEPEFLVQTWTGISGYVFLRQRLHFEEGYKYPLLLCPRVSSSSIKDNSRSTFKSSPSPWYLPMPPPNQAHLWRIEGEGPDLHLHQADFYFPLILLRAP